MQALRTYIVEDNQVIQQSLVTTLQELAPVQVVGSAIDESTARQWLAQATEPVDLVIVDLFLKSGSGLGLLRCAQNLQWKTRMVVLSNYATPDIRRKCMEFGANRVFDKSNDIDALLAYCHALANGEDTRPGALDAT